MKLQNTIFDLNINEIKKVFKLCMMYFILLMLYYTNGSSISYLLYFLIFILSIKNELFLFILLGASNYLPSVNSMSPLLLCCVELGMVTLLNCYIKKNKKLVLFKLDRNFYLLFFMLVWTLITGVMQHNLSFFSNILNFLILYFIIKLFIVNENVQIEEIFKYIIMGIGLALLITICIQIHVPGFVSNHIFRLAIGVKSDPNSTGLLLGILTVYLFSEIREKLKCKLSISALLIVVFGFSIYALILTQSRGTILSVAFTMLFSFAFFRNKKNKISFKNFINYLFFFIFVFVAFILLKENLMITNAISSFLERLSDPVKNEGARLYLLKETMKCFVANPILGISLDNFKLIAGHIPHNAFSDYVVTNGIFGIVFFLMFYLFPLWSSFKVCKKQKNFSLYLCYLVAVINILNYSASGEKLIVVIILLIQEVLIRNKYSLNRKEV